VKGSPTLSGGVAGRGAPWNDTCSEGSSGSFTCTVSGVPDAAVDPLAGETSTGTAGAEPAASATVGTDDTPRPSATAIAVTRMPVIHRVRIEGLHGRFDAG
jgi:hypothetical protein